MISEMDYTRGMKEIEERYGSAYTKSNQALIKKNLDKAKVTPDEWDDLVPYICGRQKKKPTVRDFPDALSDIRGEGRRKGGGPQPPLKGSGHCIKCKGEGVLMYRKKRSVIFCGCENSDVLMFRLMHYFDHGKECYIRHKGKLGKEPPVLKDYIAAGYTLAEFEDIHGCRLHENREQQRTRNWEEIRELCAGNKWIPQRIMDILNDPNHVEIPEMTEETPDIQETCGGELFKDSEWEQSRKETDEDEESGEAPF
jgi:hypothetical protein